MNTNRLIQFQCGKEGTLFYYQTGTIAVPYFVNHCPVCGSKRVEATGREYPAVNENEPVKTNRRRRERREARNRPATPKENPHVQT